MYKKIIFGWLHKHEKFLQGRILVEKSSDVFLSSHSLSAIINELSTFFGLICH